MNWGRGDVEMWGRVAAAVVVWIPACAGMTEGRGGKEEGWVLGSARYPRRARV